MAKPKKLPSGSYRVQASITVDGKLVRRSFTDPNPKKAAAAAAQWQAQMNDTYKIENITLSDAFKRYIESKINILSPSSIAAYKKIHRTAFQDIMTVKIERLTSEAIQKSVNLYAANHSPKSVRSAHGLLSAVLSMFRPEMVLRTRLPQKEKIEMYIPTDEDIHNLLKYSKDNRCYLAILIGAFGGLRQGEICALTSDDIVGNCVSVTKSMVLDDHGQWHTKAPKTYTSNRVVELPDFVIDSIKDIEGRIVPENPRVISKLFARLIKKHDMPHFRFHDLRHYYVSTLHSLNIPDKYIAEQGGWKTNYTMKNVYTHTLKNHSTEFSQKITSHFNNLISE